MGLRAVAERPQGGYLRLVKSFLSGVLAVALAVLLIAASAAQAATFTVNDSGDDPDALADGLCLSAGGQCTLRAAVEEANRTVGLDQVGVAGSVTDPIDLNSALTISAPLALDGCSADPGHDGPCVEVKAAGELLVAADGASVAGVDWLGPAAIHFGDGHTGFGLRNNWFGVDLAGTLQHDLNPTVLIEGDGAQIGGTAAGDRNVFAWNEVALRILGADNTVVEGNDFGVRPNGAAGGNGIFGIAVTRGADDDVPVGTIIGGELGSGALATPECDGACNAFGSIQHAIDLDPISGNGPSGTTTISGNQLGLVSYVAAGVHAGSASDVLVGGSEDGERNRFGACYDGVFAEDPDGLAIVNNSFGLAPGGAQLDYTCTEAAVRLEGDLGAALVADNEIAGMGTPNSGNMPAYGLLLLGDGATVVGNEIGAGTSERARFYNAPVDIEGHENLIGGEDLADANVMRGGREAGVEILGGDYNAIIGNVLEDNDGPAILVDRLPIENAIGNVLAPNVGTGNAGLFIDLTPDEGPGVDPDNGPHGGIQPPSVAGGGPTHASGLGKPGAQVVVFERAAGGDPGDVDRVLGEATVAADGRWSATLSGATPGALLVATQTADEGTSELSDGVAVAPAGDLTAPQTTIVHPDDWASASTSVYSLASSEPGTYQCRWDGGAWNACPQTGSFPALLDGGHTLEATAVDAAGNVDPSAAQRNFTLDTVAPDTRFGSVPARVVAGLPATFTFHAGEPGVTFRCVIDGQARPCESPLVLILNAGRHRLEVVATDRAGNRDASAAVREFEVVDETGAQPPQVGATLRGDLRQIAQGLAKVGLRGILAHPRGLVLKGVDAPGAGTLRLRALAGKVLVIGGARTVHRAGKVGLRVKPTGAGRKLLHRHSRRLAVSIELSFTSAEGARHKSTRRVVLR
jgi:hypothetical protein